MTAGDERHLMLMTQPDDRLHLVGRRRKHDDGGRLAQMRQPVAFVGEQLELGLGRARARPADAPYR